MRGYVITSGLMFLLLALIDLVRLATDGGATLNPISLASTLMSTGMTVWAVRSLVAKPKQINTKA